MGIFDWFKKQAKKDAIQLEEDGDHVSVYATLSKEDGKGIGLEEAQAMQAEVLTLLSANDNDSAMNAACQMLAKGSYEQSIQAFNQIMEKFPDQKGVCCNQIGAAYFFLAQYEKAVEYYLLSLENGFEAEMLDYNVWEAAEEHYKVAGDTSLAQIYVDKFPEGEAISQAKKLLS